jgi:Zn-dependent protease with chaperone function
MPPILYFAGIVLIGIGYTGWFFARIIQARVCRQREFLADAAAVQFTRNPRALAGALRQLGAASHGSRIDEHLVEQLAHMFFASSRGDEWDWLATHPSVADRIRAVDPAWDGYFNSIYPVAAQNQQ